jgi:endonuclease/exonuclease/phosphatase family metal-dependent hydrolase
MKTTIKAAAAAGLFILTLFPGCAQRQTNKANLRLLYWNIQNGMWSGQGDNYTRFVNWVSAQNPDVCVWCESVTNYKTASDEKIKPEEAYLPEHWGELARRYGHEYWYKGGHRDNFPQVITSKYPIENVARLIGAVPDSIVSHGAGWAQIRKNGHTVNIVSLHTWPQVYGFGLADKQERKASAAAREGDRFRRMEIEYVCNHTIGSVAGAEKQLWMMMGDFNSKSRVDNYEYGFPEDTTAFLVHDYIRQHTPYVDVIAAKYPGEFQTTTGRRFRIDYVYCTRPLYDRIVSARVVSDEYTTPVRDPQELRNFWHPSDHRPIIIDFDMR